MDKRWAQLAGILVGHSTRVQPGERVMIAMKEAESLPLTQAVYEACVKAGAHVQVQFLSDTLAHALLRYGTPEQAAWLPEVEAFGMEWADVYLGLRAAHNLHELADVEAKRLADHRRTMGKISTLRWEKTRWCLVPVPTAAMAQQAQTDEESLLDMFFAATLRDWAAELRRWTAVAEQLKGGREVRLTGRQTDLRFSVAGRAWAVDNGRSNMPGGEIWTAPVTSTLDGQIYFEFPGVLGGRLVPDIQLEWRRGTLVRAEASANQDFLQEVVRLDAGASLLGEFAFGTNAGLDRACNDILIDEKIGGTVHVALGRAYPEVGDDNQSALHWDIIKDTRQEGAVYLDERKVFERGKFLVE